MAAFGDDEDDKRRRACPIQLTLMAAMLLIIGTVSTRVPCCGKPDTACQRSPRGQGKGARRVGFPTVAGGLSWWIANVAFGRTVQVFLVVGIPELIKGADGGTALVTLGSLTFLPGSYACIVLFGAWQRWRGYSYDSLPAYD
jgi:hypothetical protein